MKTVMSHQFSQVPKAEIQRSAFNRSHGYKTTFDAGYLIPIFVDEALPGDTHILNLHAFARLATPKLPIMDNMFMDFFFFSVPNRLLWTNWQRFMGERDPDPDSSIDYTIPTINMGAGASSAVGSLEDYFGLPLGLSTASLLVSALPFRAYNLIWNQWFRDQNLQDSVTVRLTDSGDVKTDYTLLRRGKRHDYFTSCLPDPQKGNAIDVPLSGTAEVIPNVDLSTIASFERVTGSPTAGPLEMAVTTFELQDQDDNIVWMNPNGSLLADLSTTTVGGFTINDLREAFQLQKLLERDMRGGTRYIEIILSHFSVSSPDLRATRPIYLGGGSIPVNVNQVANTTSIDSTASPSGVDMYTGQMAGYGIAQGKGVGFTYSATEHCTLIGLVSVRADLTYSQGVERFWSRSTRYDFYWPVLGNLGEQAVLNQEIFFLDDDPQDNEGVFGYQERYAEYRYKPSRITGLFRPDVAGTLRAWHLSQEFSSLPALDDTFIQDNPPIDEVIVVPSEPHFLYDSYLDYKTVRPMPVYSIPGLIDHF